ncbi:glycoside hydrolase family 16 protein [Atractiella rhizophila]|nr:glycoside hydrolase family 16 protein [Atractiella rhizophila]
MSRTSTSTPALDPASIGVLKGTIGGSFSPFPPSSDFHSASKPSSARDLSPSRGSASASDLPHRSLSREAHKRYSTTGAEFDLEDKHDLPYLPSWKSAHASYDSLAPSPSSRPRHVDDDRRESYHSGISTAFTASSLLWTAENKEADDWLHDPHPSYSSRGRWGKKDGRRRPGFSLWSGRGWLNVFALVILVCGLLALFIIWPIFDFYFRIDTVNDTLGGFGPGGTNASGQVGEVAGWSGLIDKDTPASALSWTSPVRGDTLNLVWSDEFEVDGRTFYPGDDPFFEAVDLHYWATADLEWYHPDAVRTRNGKMEITMSQEPINGLNWKSGMVQTWNKFCFTGGYIEVNVSLPGRPVGYGIWPGAWTIGNLVRPGYGATAEGVWPFSYDACDVGTFPNQTRKDGTPEAARTTGSSDYGGALSYSIGQKLSACTCPGEDHPGPRHDKGRSGPEIDILEAQVAWRERPIGSVSQSIQVGPFDSGYYWKNTSGEHMVIYDPERSIVNAFYGAVYQESVSVISATDGVSYDDAEYKTFAFDYEPGPNGWIDWYWNGEPNWTMFASAIGPDEFTEISQRLISEEPMHLILNFAFSTKFQGDPSWGSIVWPQTYRIESARVYQRGKPKIGCDPKDYPTSEYVQNHPEAYMNPLRTTWEQAGYSMPRNGLYEGSC